MEYIVILVITILTFILLAIIFELKVKQVKQIGDNSRLNELAKSFPENTQICREMLKKLNNESVTIKEEENSSTNLYTIYDNSILIGSIKNTYTRVQTIAHECIHSTQSKRLLWFNFIFTNIYLLFFLSIVVLTLLGKITNPILMISIFIFFSMIQYTVRSLLETEAMVRAPYLAKEYMKDKAFINEKQIEEIIEEYEKLNKIGIKIVMYDLLLKNEIKLIIYLAICIAIYGI